MCPQASHPETLPPSATAQLSHLLLIGTISTVILTGTESLISQAAQANPVIGNQTAEVAAPTETEFSLKTEPDLDADLAGTVAGETAIAPPATADSAMVDAFTNATDYQSLDVQTVEEKADVATVPPVSEPIATQQLPAPRSNTRAVSTPIPTFVPVLSPSSVSTDAKSSHPPTDTQIADVQSTSPAPSESSLLGVPIVRAQAAYILQDGVSSERLRATGTYAVTPNLLFGATLDLTNGDAFADSENPAFDLNELYVTVSPASLPNLHLTAGMVDLTSYFDRNSFAKDSVTHFFNPVFQTNPALAATGIGSRPTALLSWDITEDLNVKAAGFSSSRDFGSLAIDGFAGEVGARFGNFVVRGTYSTDRDAGQDDGFREIFQFNRGNDRFGLRSGDREEAYGVNAELFIPELKLGLFGRYGHYQNLALDRGGETYSFGLNLLDVFLTDDRLGLAYGQQLSNSRLRQGDDKNPDVLEAFYDFRLSPNLRAGVMVQERNGFSDTVMGLRIRADFNVK